MTEDRGKGDRLPQPKPIDLPTTAFDSHLKSMGCYFPWSLVEDYMYDKPECSIPPDVTKALGPEAAEELEARYGPSSKEPLQLEGEAWWLRGVPCFIKVLLLERRLEKEYAEKMLAKMHSSNAPPCRRSVTRLGIGWPRWRLSTKSCM